jgi:hypothetical protein
MGEKHHSRGFAEVCIIYMLDNLPHDIHNYITNNAKNVACYDLMPYYRGSIRLLKHKSYENAPISDVYYVNYHDDIIRQQFILKNTNSLCRWNSSNCARYIIYCGYDPDVLDKLYEEGYTRPIVNTIAKCYANNEMKIGDKFYNICHIINNSIVLRLTYKLRYIVKYMYEKNEYEFCKMFLENGYSCQDYIYIKGQWEYKFWKYDKYFTDGKPNKAMYDLVYPDQTNKI